MPEERMNNEERAQWNLKQKEKFELNATDKGNYLPHLPPTDHFSVESIHFRFMCWYYKQNNPKSLLDFAKGE